MSPRKKRSLGRRVLHDLGVLVGSMTFTAAFFLVLPLIQAISPAPGPDTVLRSVDPGFIPPPEEMPPEPEPEEEEPEEEPLELEEADPLDLDQLSIVINPSLGGWLGGGPGFDLESLRPQGGPGGDAGAFSLGDLDQEPRGLQQPQPVLSAKIRRHTPGWVVLSGEVDEQGRVQDARVFKSSDPIFEKPVLEVIKRWRYEPGRRNGKVVRFKIRQRFTFNEMR